MANFEIDNLVLTYNGTNDYSINGTCNQVAANPPIAITGLFSADDDEIAFDINSVSDKIKISLNCNSIDFSSCKSKEVFDLNFRDFQDVGADDQSKGGISIKDTNYPPPRNSRPFKDLIVSPTQHELFTEQFTITILTLNRNGADTFDIQVDLVYTSPNTKYTKDNIMLDYDTVHKRNVIVMNVLSVKDNLNHVAEPLRFVTTNSINLNVDKGLGIVIKETTTPWSADINAKKGLIYMI